jgi:hypothetical protein
MKKRKNIIAELLKEAQIEKIAEEVSTDENLASIEDPNEYAHKVFEALLSNIKIEGIDD